MLRHSPAGRLLATVLATWFVVFSTEPMALHECAMHSPVATPTAGHAGHAADGHAMAGDAMVGHDHAMAGMAAEDGKAPTDAPHHAVCTCPGGCTATTVEPEPQASVVAVAEVATPTAAPAPRDDHPRHAAPDRLLPFANGPPLTA
jgi:hypothetical protein